MVFFKWKDEYELGLPHIDLQHTMIVNMINELFVSLGSEEADFTAKKTLDKMMLYVEEHFASEETAMQENNYPALEDHLKEHNDFRGKVEKMYRNHQAGDKVAGFELIEFLKDWFQSHIVKVDKEFGKYVYQLSEEARKAFFQ